MSERDTDQNSDWSLNHLAKLKEAAANGPIQRDEALFLFGLVRVLRPRVIVEFGFHRGHSALNFLKALNGDGEVYSYDNSPKAAEHARNFFSKFSGFHFVNKGQDEFSPNDVAGRIDLAFIDGSHELGLNKETFRRILPSLADSSIIIVHDTGTWNRSCFQTSHRGIARERPDGWLPGGEYQHRREEREFVNWVPTAYPEYQVIHFHSLRCIRHGLTFLQKQTVLETSCASI